MKTFEGAAMTDRTTGKKLTVSSDGRAGAYLVVSEREVSEVRQVLDLAGIPYWVDEIAISVDGRPAQTVVNFERATNPDAVQDVLDKAA
jgi:hypothetical protein